MSVTGHVWDDDGFGPVAKTSASGTEATDETKTTDETKATEETES